MVTDKYDLSVTLSGIKLDNPIIPASGTFGFGYEYKDFYDLNILGSISLKGTTSEPRIGNPVPRIAECTEGILNSVGLQNPGIDKVIQEEIPKISRYFKKPLIANISGFSINEYVECAEKISSSDKIGIIEINISCPNVKNGGMSFGSSSELAGRLTREVKKVSTKPVYIKLTPNVANIVEIAKSCRDNGADGICAINTILGMRLNRKTGKPILANIFGGLSGPAIFPVALRIIYQIASSINIPVIGCGGVSDAGDVIEMMMAGASAVEVGTMNLIDPLASKKIIESLPEEMEKLGINNLRDIIGKSFKQ